MVTSNQTISQSNAIGTKWNRFEACQQKLPRNSDKLPAVGLDYASNDFRRDKCIVSLELLRMTSRIREEFPPNVGLYAGVLIQVGMSLPSEIREKFAKNGCW